MLGYMDMTATHGFNMILVSIFILSSIGYLFIKSIKKILLNFENKIN